jgi:hypothetical protein
MCARAVTTGTGVGGVGYPTLDERTKTGAAVTNRVKGPVKKEIRNEDPFNSPRRCGSSTGGILDGRNARL